MSRILIIDDDPLLRNACARVLSAAGHEVACAASGNEGLVRVGSGPENVDLVLLDRLMPGMSGADVLEGLRALAPDLPVIVITGSATEESAAEILSRGARDCLPKPFNPTQLRRAVECALNPLASRNS